MDPVSATVRPRKSVPPKTAALSGFLSAHNNLEAFHCSSAVSGWWSIATWANGRHSFMSTCVTKAVFLTLATLASIICLCLTFDK